MYALVCMTYDKFPIINSLLDKFVEAKTVQSKTQIAVKGFLILISVLFLLYAVYTGWEEINIRLKHLNYWLFLITLALYPLGFLPLIGLWHKIMCCIGGCCTFRTNARLYSLSCIPKRIPSAFWYVSSRVLLYREHQVNYAITLAGTIIETACLTFSGLLIYLLSLPMGIILTNLNYRLLYIAIGFSALILAIPLLWTSLSHRISHWFQVRNTSVRINFNAWDVLQLIGISILAWLGGGLLLFILSNALTSLPLTHLPSVIAIWSVAGSIGLISGFLAQGLGLREATLAVMLSSYMPLPIAVAVSILFRFLLNLGEFIWALIVARLSR